MSNETETTAISDRGEAMNARLDQVADQCAVVVHLAGALVDVYGHHTKMFRERTGAAVDLVDLVGQQTANIMNTLGDILNGMDAVSEEDEWTDPVFEKARRLWKADPT